jgi:hypothetical protein
MNLGGTDEETFGTGADETSDTDANDETAGITGDASPVDTDATNGCNLDTHESLSNVPDGWHGPVARIDGDREGGCLGSFDGSAIETYASIVADAVECGCECGPPADGTCADNTLVEIYPPWSVNGIPHNANTCDTLEEEVTVSIDQPEPYPTSWNWNETWLIAAQPPVAQPGACAVIADTTDIPDPELMGALEACDPADRIENCDDETICVPRVEAPFEDGVCIWRMGDHACPAGTDFVDRELRNIGVDDSRGCSDCSCDAATDEVCNDAEITLLRTAGGPVVVDADGTCRFAELGDATWTTITYVPGPPSGGACALRGGEAEGTLEAVDQVTFCCT